MIKIMDRKSKTKQYIIGGAVAVVILCLWVSIPLMQNSSMDASVASGNFFKTRTADVNSLGNDIPQEGGAPGYALNGEMLNNPATSGENMASSLFQSGPDDETAASSATTDQEKSPAPLPGASASAGVPEPSSSGPKGKLSAMPSITGSNSNTMTVGGTHDKFFGSGAAKSNFAPASDQGLKTAAASDKRNSLVAMLQKTEEKSALAAKTPNLASAAGSATSAFEKTSKPDTSDLNSDMERNSASSGLALGAAAQDLKRNDPQLSKSKVSLPEPKPVKDDSKAADEEMKKMIMQMLISSVIGPMFSSIFTVAPAAGGK